MKVNARLPILISCFVLLPLDAAGQSDVPELNLGRIRVINRSIDAYATEQNLFIVPNNYSFKVAYKLQDNSRYEPFNTRATAELNAQYIFGRFGTAEDWYRIWRQSDKKENMNPTATYLKESSFTGSETLSADELMRRCVIWLHGESGKSGDTDSRAFTLIREPSRGDRLFIHTAIENEVAKANYQLFRDNLREFADASGAQQQLQDAMTRLWHNAKLFIEHYDLYADTQGAWADVIAWALSKRFPGIGELWMLIEYKTYAENLINDVNSSVSTAINMSTLAKGMKVDPRLPSIRRLQRPAIGDSDGPIRAEGLRLRQFTQCRRDGRSAGQHRSGTRWLQSLRARGLQPLRRRGEQVAATSARRCPTTKRSKNSVRTCSTTTSATSRSTRSHWRHWVSPWSRPAVTASASLARRV